LEYLILSIISKGESYTNDIIKTLKKANLIVVEGTMYPLLSRLKSEKLLEYIWVESQQ
jgi:PadR family transcriptional regulator PadR